MSPKSRQHLTLAGVVSGITLVVASLGMLANGVIALDKKMGVGTTAQDSLFRNDSVLFAEVAALKKAARIRSKAVAAAAPPPSEGMVRRMFHLLF